MRPHSSTSRVVNMHLRGEEWDKAVAYWKTLKSGDDAVFDKELTFEAKDIEPRITYGTNPGMGIGITESIPTLDEIPEEEQAGFKKSPNYIASSQARNSRVILSIMYSWAHVPTVVLKTSVLSLPWLKERRRLRV